MSTVTVMFEIDGQPVRGEDASWYEVAPCGCYCGVMSAIVGDQIFTDEEAVWKDIFPNAEQRRRTRKLGFRQVLGLRSQAQERLSAKCPHTPLYGVEKTPVPAGHEWAREDGGTKGRRKHLVPGSFAEHDWNRPAVAALCGASTWAWSSKFFLLADVPECVKCQRAAKTLAAAPAES